MGLLKMNIKNNYIKCLLLIKFYSLNKNKERNLLHNHKDNDLLVSDIKKIVKISHSTICKKVKH